MGAVEFTTKQSGETVKEAFRAAVEHAQYMNGHGGYTGTIAEKGSFTLIPRSEMEDGEDEYEFARRLINERDNRIDDKWCPAGSVKINENNWLFFGKASY